MNAINILNNTATNTLRDAVENVFAVDNWLWFLAIENVFVDDDSYFDKGADYSFYWEVESGRIHPVEHDGNESFAAVTGVNYNLSPVYGDTLSTRPLLYRLLPIKELRQRYLAHMRTILKERFNPGYMTTLINRFHALSIAAIVADPIKGYTTMSTYTNDLVALKTYVTNRYNYLMTHAELTPLQPTIAWTSGPSNTVYTTNIPTITTKVTSNGASGVGSVWLYFRDKSYGRFTVRQMYDDGVHGDGAAGDSVFGAVTTNYPAGNKIHFYIEARATNAAQAAVFAPERAEIETYDYSVALSEAASTPVVINEIMADNATTLADPQGESDDWIELHNLTGASVSLTGYYLTDDASDPRKWAFPAGRPFQRTVIYLSGRMKTARPLLEFMRTSNSPNPASRFI
ncbi:MAG: CotH kinase family protein [Verrucomicrobiota bacterium]